MQNYLVRLQSPISSSFRCQKAADSLDINVEEKSIHELKISADLESDFQIGMIVGSSGSGKTTLAKKIFGDDCFTVDYDPDLPVIDQFPKSMSYDECSSALLGIGLTSVPCWIRPLKTLSNGQQARAIAALSMHSDNDQIILIDEWTSVVDRTVAKVMSHCVQKHARRTGRKIILLSCHFDVIDWVDPDWVINCNDQTFNDRRLLRPEDRQRTEKLEFSIRETDRSTWNFFSKYHYLSKKFPGGPAHCFGMFHNNDQIGIVVYSAYIAGRQYIRHFNRLVIHPDYAGLGLGIQFVNKTAEYMKSQGFDVRGKFSSIPVYKALIKDEKWKYMGCETKIKKSNVNETNSNYGRKRARKDGKKRKDNFRSKVKMHTFKWRGQSSSSGA